MIQRAPRDYRFVMVPNATARDSRLSFRARGLLAFILSQPDGWQGSIDDIADQLRREATEHGGEEAAKAVEGRDALRTAMNELVAAGYVLRQRVQGEGGRWRTDVIVHDVPVEAPADGAPTPGKPTPGNPSSARPALLPRKPRSRRRLENRPSVDQASKEEDQGEDQDLPENQPPLTPPASAATVTDLFGEDAPRSARGGRWEKEFVAFVAAYPRASDVTEAKLRSAFRSAAQRMNGGKAVLASLDAWNAVWSAEDRDPQYIPFPARWLREKAGVVPPEPRRRRPEEVRGPAPPPDEPWTLEMQERLNREIEQLVGYEREEEPADDVPVIGKPLALARQAIRRPSPGLPPLATEGGEVHTGPRAPRVARAGASAVQVSSPPSPPKEATP